MPKPPRRVRRPRATASHSDDLPAADASRQSESPATRGGPDPRPLLARLLETPQLAQLIPRLQPEVLHRVIERCGLEDCGELVALATPGQLAGVLDIDLWRSDRPGLDEQFDADRFGVWLEVLLESDAAAAARTLAGIDVALVTAALAQYVLVFDPATVMPSGEMDDEDIPVDRASQSGVSCEVGGYLVVARRTDAWDAIVGVLIALDAQHHNAFHRVMRGCRALSNSTPEIDGLDDLLTGPEQVMFDLAADRERRRERHGYATPAEARAFLQMARQLRLDKHSRPPANPVANAYFRAVDETSAPETSDATQRLPASISPPAPDPASAVASLVDLLTDEGVLPRPPRALLDAPQGRASRLSRIQSQLQFAHDRDSAAYLMRSHELAFLANTMVAGCSVQARPFTLQEASDAALSVCNLGLENWPSHWLTTSSRPPLADGALPDDFLVGHDLVNVFQVGWNVLHHQVCMFSAEQLIGVLRTLKSDDRDTQAALRVLRAEMTKHWHAGAPWAARAALDVIAILDLPAWAALLGLIDQCPVVHAGIAATRGSRILAVDPAAFEFIAGNGQIASIREYLRSLPATLRG